MKLYQNLRNEIRYINPKNKNFMIISRKEGDIFTTKDKHIIFALNTDGLNDSGFAGVVAKKRGFTEILNTGGNQLGEVLHKTIDGITYWGIVCHSLKLNGWSKSPEIIRKALDEMPFEDDASIVSIGSGLVGLFQGAPWKEIEQSFKDCNKRLTLWAR